MGGGGQNTVQTTTQELSPEQRKLLEGVIPIATNFLKNPPKQFAGSGIAGFTPLQQAGQQMTMNAVNQMTPTLNQIPGQYNAIQSGLGNVANQAGNQAANVANNVNRNIAAGNAAMQPGLNYLTGGQVLNNGQSAGLNYLASGQGLKAGGSQGLNFLTSGQVLNPNANPALQQATQAAIRPFVQNFQDQIMPSLANDAIMAGGYGGTRQGIAEGLAGRELLRQTGDITANMANNAYNSGLSAMTSGLATDQARQAANLGAMTSALSTDQARNATNLSAMTSGLNTMQNANQANNTAMIGAGQLQQGAGQLQAQSLGQMMTGLGQAGNILSQGLLPAQLTSAVGEQQQAMQQALLQEQIQKYVNQQLIPFSAAQDVAALAYGIPGGTQTSNATSSGGGAGILPFLQAGAGIATALPALFSLFSDRRVKTDIQQVGTLSDGLGVYVYKYVGEMFDRIGLMADEVKKLYPMAVKDENGIDKVDYSLVPTW